jgi:Fe-S-cluster containining protein
MNDTDTLTFSTDVIRELLNTSVNQRQELGKTYARLSATRCRRKTYCCSLLPEMTLVEALVAIQRLSDMAPAVRRQMVRTIIRYFFLNPAEIISCPFLDSQDCLIYQDRFFGCRAYGLWSKDYYEKLVSRSRQVKVHFQRQWKKLGVPLPQPVIDFQVPYCRCVEPDGNGVIDDSQLMRTADAVNALSGQFSEWHELFGQKYFFDLSFFLASLVFGFAESVKMKFVIVREIVTTGNRTGLDRILGDIPDILAGIA